LTEIETEPLSKSTMHISNFVLTFIEEFIYSSFIACTYSNYKLPMTRMLLVYILNDVTL